MRIGLVGVGRIGAFHAETLQGLERVDELMQEIPGADLLDVGTAPLPITAASAEPQRADAPAAEMPRVRLVDSGAPAPAAGIPISPPAVRRRAVRRPSQDARAPRRSSRGDDREEP